VRASTQEVDVKIQNAIYAYEVAAREHREGGNRELAMRAERAANQLRMSQFVGRTF
jgi:hypothetical protein